MCPHCQTTIPDNVGFCPACGRRIDRAKIIATFPDESAPGASTSPQPTGQPIVDPTPVAAPMSITLRRPRRSRRLLALTLATVVMLIAATATAGVMLIQRQARQRIGQWRQIHLVAGQAVPTPPPGSYVFVSIDGATVYRPPTHAPIPTTWRKAQDTGAGYSLDVPSNWMSPASAPSTLALPGGATFCPPNTSLDTQQPGLPPCVSYGNMASYAPPTSDTSMSPLAQVPLRGGTATVFTRSALGALVIAYVPDRSGDFVLIANADSDAAMYAFQHMLTTLTLS